MNPKDYFENNKDKIHLTAEFLAKKEGKDVESVFESVKNEFYNSYGSSDGEYFCLNNGKIVVTDILKGIRFLEYEQMMVFLFNGQRCELLCCWKGNQFSSNFDLDELKNKLILLKIKNIFLQNIALYIVHNHPYKYRAVPSDADFEVLENVMALIKEMNRLDTLCKTTLVDFAVVTSFDYWSYKQNCD